MQREYRRRILRFRARGGARRGGKLEGHHLRQVKAVRLRKEYNSSPSKLIHELDNAERESIVSADVIFTPVPKNLCGGQIQSFSLLQSGRICLWLRIPEQSQEGHSCAQSQHHEAVGWSLPQGRRSPAVLVIRVYATLLNLLSAAYKPSKSVIASCSFHSITRRRIQAIIMLRRNSGKWQSNIPPSNRKR